MPTHTKRAQDSAQDPIFLTFTLPMFRFCHCHCHCHSSTPALRPGLPCISHFLGTGTGPCYCPLTVLLLTQILLTKSIFICVLEMPLDSS